MKPGGFEPPLCALGLDERTAASLAQYLAVLSEWSRRINLTAAAGPAELVKLLVEPVLAGRAWVRPGRLLDIGSGNGSPGLVLALLCPELRVTLLEPRQRRWAFLREAARQVGRGDVDVRRERIEDHAAAPVETVTLRAVRVAAGRIAAQLLPEGRALVWGRGLDAPEEAGLATLAAGLAQPHVYELVSRGTAAGCT